MLPVHTVLLKQRCGLFSGLKGHGCAAVGGAGIPLVYRDPSVGALDVSGFAHQLWLSFSEDRWRLRTGLALRGVVKACPKLLTRVQSCPPARPGPADRHVRPAPCGASSLP